MQSLQDIAIRMPITRVKLITISIVTIRSIWHKSAADFLFWKISATNLQILWATYQWNYGTFSVL